MNTTHYDVIITGGGHNGLVAACYLALAGRRVLVLEKNADLGGATRSARPFPGVDATLSIYSYLVSLLPGKILTDLSLRFETRTRAVASYTPVGEGGLLISNVDDEITRQSFRRFTGSDAEYARFCRLEDRLTRFAQIVWPTLLEPLPAKEQLRQAFTTPEERETFDYLVERPLAHLIEDHLTDDAVRGAVFTDAKIGVSTYPADPSLLQNRTFLYHIIGQGTGEWRVPVGGMGALIDALTRRARSLGVEFLTGAEVTSIDILGESGVHALCEVTYLQGGSPSVVAANWVLVNASADVLNRLLPGALDSEQVEGSVFKINLLLKRLPALKDPHITPAGAFTGTFHLNEGYDNLTAAYHESKNGPRLQAIPGEMYCHTLTDPSILSAELQSAGYHTLTLFGLDVPYRWFVDDNDRTRQAVTDAYLRAINQHLREDITTLLAVDDQGRPCLEAKTPVDLETALSLSRGKIFHGNLTWPFAVRDEQVGAWGVETRYPRVLICGSSAIRGGAVSGIPGHNAAMKVLAGG